MDVEWYLTQQILPPIARLCEPIEGTSLAILAERLGLDKRYVRLFVCTLCLFTVTRTHAVPVYSTITYV